MRVRVELLQNCVGGCNVGEIVGMEEAEAKEREATKQVRVIGPVVQRGQAMHRAELQPVPARVVAVAEQGGEAESGEPAEKPAPAGKRGK